MWMWEGKKDWGSETEIKRVTNQTKKENGREKEETNKKLYLMGGFCVDSFVYSNCKVNKLGYVTNKSVNIF